MQSQSSQNNDHQSSPSLPSVRAGSRKNRVYVFREFVQNVYGSYLRQETNSVILDVAGGKGDLSWLFRNVDNIDAVVVDPRLTHSKHILRSIQYLREHPDQAKERAVPGRLTYQPLAAILPQLEGKECFDTPRHLRLLVDHHLVEAVLAYKQDYDVVRWEEFWKGATQRASDTHTLGYKEGGGLSENTIEQSSVALKTILSTKMVVGFHPDQATDLAVDLALALEVPYCIVPCCVFPREFPHRRTPSGDHVRDYGGLLEYLKAKYYPLEDRLPFYFTDTAKNIVLYSLPKNENILNREAR